MIRTQLIRKLSENAVLTNRRASFKTVASQLNVVESLLKAAAQSINSDGIYAISTYHGGGVGISGGLDKEKDTYVYVEGNLEAWVRTNIYGKAGVTDLWVAQTHKKKLDGKWSTPDFSLLGVHKFLHLPQSSVDVVSIEIKHASLQFDVACVYEALAHSRMSAYSILFFYEDPAWTIQDMNAEDALEEIRNECARLGVGLVISQYPAALDRWDYHIPARRNEPDPRRVDAFISVAFTQKQRDELAKKL
ncbi:hypothetical protein ACOTGI_24280 [Achromobacter xylosoxidans]|jgi:hypothetical protein|uniref:Uncharacterized protein n=1 Tax=Alcaligenes xylosoxydans xylosoxydans TaxID=85698 RepID=A0A9X3KWK5_ALCXX|nr:hypothetical protein [Achromobacter xylosoxidans]MCZ8401515.1 hypothetical protein [Achromobacter xylosoxidans]CUJ29810.1 Uncharacterised protein [Achromobacter xylosoxidans]